MATKKRSGLGRGIGALIPSKPAGEDRPVDVFFPTTASRQADAESEVSPAAAQASTESEPPRQSASEMAPAAPGKTRSTPSRSKTARAEREPREETARPASSSASEAPDPSESADQEDRGATEEREGLLPVPGATLTELDPRAIAPNLRQPRTQFDAEKLEELTVSVREFGVLQPIVVRPIRPDHPAFGEAEYELIMGERRLRASRAAGLDRIPAVVRHTDDADMLRDALLENIHRAELNPLEEASAYQQLLEDFGITQEELAKRIGRSRPQISNTLRLLRLPIEVQRRVAAGVLSAGHARAILSVGEPAAMTQLAEKIVNEDLSVRAAEAAAQRHAPRTTPRSTSRTESGGGLSAYLEDAAERLGDRLNTRVKVTLRKTKGQIVVDFASINDLNRILQDLGVETEV